MSLIFCPIPCTFSNMLSSFKKVALSYMLFWCCCVANRMRCPSPFEIICLLHMKQHDLKCSRVYLCNFVAISGCVRCSVSSVLVCVHNSFNMLGGKKGIYITNDNLTAFRKASMAFLVRFCRSSLVECFRHIVQSMQFVSVQSLRLLDTTRGSILSIICTNCAENTITAREIYANIVQDCNKLHLGGL